MPDNTNVNNNASVVVVGRTAPVPPGQQKSDKSVPVVIASDQSTIPVAEQNKVQSEVALSLLGIPRSEVALGIFADVNTYDVNPTEWAAEPENREILLLSDYPEYTDSATNFNHGLSHIPEESGALVEAPPDRTAVLTSKRFFRYQPGRVSAATFGVKTTIMDISSTDVEEDGVAPTDDQDIGSAVHNPAIRKYGIFDNFDGYYWETRNNGQGDNFSVVRRTQSLLFNNPLDFSGSAGQTQDFGATNPLDIREPRGNETNDGLDDGDTNQGNNAVVSYNPGAGGNTNRYPVGHDSTPAGYKNIKLGDLVIYRDNLMMTHAGVYDPSLLQDEMEYAFSTIPSQNQLVFSINGDSGPNGLGKLITFAEYDIDTGLMTVTTNGDHGFQPGKFVTLAGIGMTCKYSYTNFDGTGTLMDGTGGMVDAREVYPNRTHGYNIISVPSPNTFEVNVGVSTVKTFFNAAKSEEEGARVVGLTTGQYVSFKKGSPSGGTSTLTDHKIYKIKNIGFSTSSTTNFALSGANANSAQIKIKLKDLTDGMGTTEGASYNPTNNTGTNITFTGTATTEASGNRLITPVPFVQPVANDIIYSDGKSRKIYGTNDIKHSGMFPYMYKNSADTQQVGYIDTTLDTQISNVSSLRKQIESINKFYQNWINQSIKKEFWNVYEYRVPRSRFSGDRLDKLTDNLLYSDVTAENRAGTIVRDSVDAPVTDTSIWDLEFDKVTMYKIEFSWYGAVGALFLAYVPVGSGEARWVRVHHLRASNQLKGSSLGNATLPITYLVYGGGGGVNLTDRYGYSNSKRKILPFAYGSASEHIVKYGASYYIDGGDRGTVKLFSHGTQTAKTIFGSKRSFAVGGGANKIQITESDAVNNADDPFITGGSNITGINSSYYVGAKVITGNPLDQNVEIVYVDDQKFHLNAPLNMPIPNNVDIIVNRPSTLIGLKCRDFITSSQGKDVRNRTQVYPTRLSTGSEGSVIKVDLLKTPIFQTSSVTSGNFQISTSDVNIGKRGTPIRLPNVSESNGTNTYLAEGTGTYGYMRGKLQGDASGKVVTILGYLERRPATSTTPGYYFNALKSTTLNIILSKDINFLHEGQIGPTGVAATSTQADFTLDPLSSIKVSPQDRAPIPKTGTIVASLFIPASGEEFDLSSYFDYNKEYLSFPLTNVVESLFVVGSSDKEYNPSAGISTTSASITWEEQ